MTKRQIINDLKNFLQELERTEKFPKQEEKEPVKNLFNAFFDRVKHKVSDTIEDLEKSKD